MEKKDQIRYARINMTAISLILWFIVLVVWVFAIKQVWGVSLLFFPLFFHQKSNLPMKIQVSISNIREKCNKKYSKKHLNYESNQTAIQIMSIVLMIAIIVYICWTIFGSSGSEIPFLLLSSCSLIIWSAHAMVYISILIYLPNKTLY